MQTQTLKLNSVKKHSVRYDREDEGGFVRSVYIDKSALPANVPPRIGLALVHDPGALGDPSLTDGFFVTDDQ